MLSFPHYFSESVNKYCLEEEYRYLLPKAGMIFFPQSPVCGKSPSLISEFWTSTLCSDLTTGTPARQGYRGNISAFTGVDQTRPTGANSNAFISNRLCLPQAPSTQKIICHRFRVHSSEKKRLYLCMRIHGTTSLFPSDALRVLDCEGFRFNPLLSSC